MKIISKFKDYYDFLQGTYGVDEKLILDRTTFTPTSPYFSENKVISLYIGEWLIQGLYNNGKFYYGKNVEPFNQKPKRRIFSLNEINDKKLYYFIPTNYYPVSCLKEPKYLGDDSPTWKEDCPILIQGYTANSYGKHPILKDYNVSQILPPEKIWTILSEWLGKQISNREPIVPIGDDKIRIESHGFDLKTSFRKSKKINK
ncbi:MAG TPA: hypothetical protein PKD00_01315 [Burkholderiales bacterium]|nr:hypothetical protein [Burkholderiales bacterium]